MLSPCQLVDSSRLLGMPVWVKRDDLLHPIVSGNKFRKLAYPLLNIQEQYRLSGRLPFLITMGGIWSNHLHATAYAAAQFGYPSCGLVRGHDGMQSAMLEDCSAQGMHIQFVDRLCFRHLRENPLAWQAYVSQLVVQSESEPFWLPEGGSSSAALQGVAELVDELPFIPDALLVACGTAATLAGILVGLKGRGRVVGVAVLKNAEYLHGEIAKLLEYGGYPPYRNYELLTDFHHGGYAKVSPELMQFCHDFTDNLHIPIEPIYTGKVFYALRHLIQTGHFRQPDQVMVLHTGGLQGLRGIYPSYLKKSTINRGML